ncbi:DUF5050 domain-containing protein [Gorillibacterium sp. CAU 1737]|uniref:DUF5050 domain-containing protein n=1 Tax=Gorillibacterium sp. CAU 1737 TaxID=3140362 RepID=UPI003261214D
MNRIMLWGSLIILILFSSGCSKTPTFRIFEGMTQEDGGHTPGFVQNDEAGTYFINGNGNHRIYRASQAGADKTPLGKDSASSLLLVNDWLYYVKDSDESGLYRIQTDGTNQEQLSDAFVGLVGSDAKGSVYYRDSKDNYHLKRMKFPEKEIETLVPESINEAAMAEGSIYYINNSEEGLLYRYNLSDGTKERMSSFPVRMITWSGTDLYAVNRQDQVLYRFDEQESPKPLTNLKVEHYAVQGSNIIYKTENGGLFQISRDGTSSEILVSSEDDHYYRFQILQNWLYYEDHANPRHAKLSLISLEDIGFQR